MKVARKRMSLAIRLYKCACLQQQLGDWKTTRSDQTCLEQQLGDWKTTKSDQGDQSSPQDIHVANKGCDLINGLAERCHQKPCSFLVSPFSSFYEHLPSSRLLPALTREEGL